MSRDLLRLLSLSIRSFEEQPNPNAKGGWIMKLGWRAWLMALFVFTVCSSAAAAGAAPGSSLVPSAPLIPCTCCCVGKTATIWDQGHVIGLSGPLKCPKGQVIEMRVRVTQASGVVGEGFESAICTGKKTRWTGVVTSWGFPFAAGKAHAHAWATTYSRSRLVKSWDWQGDITIH